MYRTKKRHWKIQKRRVNSHTKKAPKNNCWYFSPNHESKMYLVYWLPNSQRSQLSTQLNISNIIFCSNWWLWWLEWDWAHWLYLNSWFLVSRLFGKNEEVWPCCLVRIDVALLEEMDHWRWVLRFGNPMPSLASHNPLAPLPPHSPACFLHIRIWRFQWMVQCYTCLLPTVMTMDKPYKAINKQWLNVFFSK